MLFALFFMLRDGDALSRGLCDRLPFSAHENERLLSETRDLVTASFGAGAMVAVAQGLIAGVAFWLLGLGTPVFWGVFSAFCSLLPVVGATIVWVPTAITLLLSGETTRGVLMLLVDAFGISGVDNWLRPMLLSGKTSVSGFIVFFGLLGGAAAFGLIGLVIGPIILVITAQLLESLHHPDLVSESAAPDDSTLVTPVRAS
jgi:predicted PurR-regulated permease PerM